RHEVRRPRQDVPRLSVVIAVQGRVVDDPRGQHVDPEEREVTVEVVLPSIPPTRPRTALVENVNSRPRGTGVRAPNDLGEATLVHRDVPPLVATTQDRPLPSHDESHIRPVSEVAVRRPRSRAAVPS